MNLSRITNIEQYRDGGSIMFIFEDEQQLCIDNRLGSKTCGEFYNAYPSDLGAEIVEMSKKDIHNLICWILKFHSDKVMFASTYSAFMALLLKSRQRLNISKLEMERIQEDHIKADIFRAEYLANHACCPKCGSIKYATTLLGYILRVDRMELYKDLNKCVCSNCGDVHTTHDRTNKLERV